LVVVWLVFLPEPFTDNEITENPSAAMSTRATIHNISFAIFTLISSDYYSENNISPRAGTVYENHQKHQRFLFYSSP
jgi:hypothetical protein